MDACLPLAYMISRVYRKFFKDVPIYQYSKIFVLARLHPFNLDQDWFLSLDARSFDLPFAIIALPELL